MSKTAPAVVSTGIIDPSTVSSHTAVFAAAASAQNLMLLPEAKPDKRLETV